MLRAIQAEFMKLSTLRYVYIVTGIMAVVALLASYIIATINGPSADIPTTNTILASAVQVTLWLYVSVLAVIAALSVANEYRHNTMTYTIITVNSRIKVYLAKVVVIVVFALLSGLALALLAMMAAAIGAAVSGADLSKQVFDGGGLLIHESLHLLAFGLVGLGLGFIFRGVVVPLLLVLGLPPLELVSRIALKDGTDYLPFTSMQSLASIGSSAADPGVIIVALVYVAAIISVGVTLFIMRDA